MIQSKIDTFNKRIQELNESLEIIKRFGFDSEILEAYLSFKLKISGKQAREIINCIDDFHRKTINREIVNGLEDKK